MKKVIILIFLLLPLALASPVPPFELDEEGNEIQVYCPNNVIGGPCSPEHFLEDCPVVPSIEEGQTKFFFANIEEETGKFVKSEFRTKDFAPNEFKEKGGACGDEFLAQRPFSPGTEGVWEKDHMLRDIANAQFGAGVKYDEETGEFEYTNPDLQDAVENDEIAPTELPSTKPDIIFTGDVVYEFEYEVVELRVLVIPIQFTDQEAEVSISELEDKYFGDNGLAAYYAKESYGALTLSGDIAPQIYTLPNTMGYYGGNYESNIREMVSDAIEAADADIDYSQYDANQDGYVDAIFIDTAGDADEEDGGGNGDTIWSHYFTIPPETHDGVQIIDYETVSGTSPIGIIAHEFGHYLGLPDYYDTVVDDGTGKGTAEWSIMGYGGYMDEPGPMDPWSKGYLKWLQEENFIEVETTEFYDIVFNSADYGLKYYLMPIDEEEHFFVENPNIELINGDDASGLLIWHIDEAIIEEQGSWNGCSGTRWSCNTVNGNAEHKLIDVEEANGEQDHDDGSLGEVEDLWYTDCSAFGGCQANIFSASSEPNSDAYSGTDTSIVIGTYSEQGSSMEILASLEGTVLDDPTVEETTEESVETQEDTSEENTASQQETSESVTNTSLYIIIGITTVLLLIIGFLSFKLFSKDKKKVSPEKYKSFRR